MPRCSTTSSPTCAGPRRRPRSAASGERSRQAVPASSRRSAGKNLPEDLLLGVDGLDGHRLAVWLVAEAKRRVFADRDPALHAEDGPGALGNRDGLDEPRRRVEARHLVHLEPRISWMTDLDLRLPAP